MREGQLLATLDTVDYALGVRQLQIQYDQAVARRAGIPEAQGALDEISRFRNFKGAVRIL